MDKKYYIFLVLIAIFSLSIGIIGTAIFYSRDEVLDDLTLHDFAEETSEDDDSGCDFFVDVSGAVLNPGVFCVEEGAIVKDAIEMAGNINVQAHSFKYLAQRINLARSLEEEEKIYIPFHDDVVCGFVEAEDVKVVASVMEELDLVDKDGKVGATITDSSSSKDKKDDKVDSDCININTAGQEELMMLPGVGEARARDIIEGRPYNEREDIKEVSGIGDATYENIRDLICV